LLLFLKMNLAKFLNQVKLISLNPFADRIIETKLFFILNNQNLDENFFFKKDFFSFAKIEKRNSAEFGFVNFDALAKLFLKC